ncbi:MAG: copper resistance protein NlpE [Endomicrobia bacterium]|nr:copper resistance protein NlpE [Endomicrobiia bacterium]
MRKLTILLIPFIIAGCVPRRTDITQPSISQSTIKQVEAKALDMSRSVMLDVKELDGYFLRNNVKLNNEVNFFAIDNYKKFDNILGQAKTMTNVITMADLRKNIVAVIAMKPSQIINDIKITKAYQIGNDIYIDYEIVSQEMPEVGYFISNVKAFEIQKSEQILNVSFVDANKSMTILPFGRRTAGSPASLEAMLKYYTGRYKGAIPDAGDADGSGISVILYLSSDYTYRLEQIYLKNPARTFETAGKWTPSSDLSYFILDYDKNDEERNSFYFVDRNMIEKLDAQGERIEVNPELYRLKK